MSLKQNKFLNIGVKQELHSVTIIVNFYFSIVHRSFEEFKFSHLSYISKGKAKAISSPSHVYFKFLNIKRGRVLLTPPHLCLDGGLKTLSRH